MLIDQLLNSKFFEEAKLVEIEDIGSIALKGHAMNAKFLKMTIFMKVSLEESNRETLRDVPLQIKVLIGLQYKFTTHLESIKIFGTLNRDVGVNNRKVREWKRLRVGDIVQVEKDEFFPC
ncbi:hypothetical protein HPP92_023090 [Vanilla planifolia]|uniref:Uncharacterized protein n=1 Tax=Vanilla planifolia TaxID=51239 RepID=A0A835PYS2_VANPL|nr:hypothetical protein HPP92_023090 [Vanilla planifolia]